ncbi:peptidase associated/transthyretin-like domain-containing protein [Adhaeribacter radiodurans]|uniref:Uncharacterized protein n=1 Tax=Adhaeribacter radiodurans TaxID=2745197 RepID=A0A7L7L5Y7_9BACT|nr:hypothetical protein [Adhaeribacter radiodurans]QMU28232.1 hypothetical protein HUW48_09345 [Adhaeribacter radiodurans]
MVLFYCYFCSYFNSFSSQPQTLNSILGSVLDKTTPKPIPSATIQLKGAKLGNNTNSNDNFGLLRRAMLLCCTGTLKGSPQPN